jgi:thiol-disulfide isomerase/thioredoxin
VRSLTWAGVAVLLITPVASADEPIAKRYEQIRSDFEAQISAHGPGAINAQGQRDKPAAAAKTVPDLVVECCRRMVDLAESSPADPAARDALLWVLDNAGRGDERAYRDQFAHATALLIRHHGNDPEAIRFAVAPPSIPVTPRHEALVLGFYAAAKGRQAKGLAQLAVAEYLVSKASRVAYARKAQGRPKTRFVSGGKVVREVDLTDEQYADHLALRQCDPEAIRAEAQRLFEDVITEYADVPNVSRRILELEALLKEPAPISNGKPLTAERRRGIEESLARRNKTLGKEAEDRLDALLNLAVGKPAPEIEGVDIDGKPLKLTDYRGKVVMLVFWGSWCSPCMALVPHERDLAIRLKGQPFALLGVACEDNKDSARQAMARERMTWPNWFDGAPLTGAIVKRYHIRTYPTVFVLDAKGVIRHKSAFGTGLDDVVDKLLAEMKQPPSGRRTSSPRPDQDDAPGP